MTTTKVVSNKEFSQSDPEFKRTCEAANIIPTKRQASRYRMKKGLAYKFRWRKGFSVQIPMEKC